MFDISIALIGAVSALLGTIAGGLISFITTRELKQREWRSSILREQINEKKKVYSDFLAEATRLTWIAVESKCGNFKEFHLLGNLTAQIELIGSDGVVNASKLVMDHVLNLHSNQSEKLEKTFFEIKTMFINEVKQEINRLLETN